MAKPGFRDRDPNPSRADDIKFSFMGATLEASGRMVVMMIIAVAAAAFAFVHDWRSNDAHDRLAEGFAVMTCVLTLNEGQREEFRMQGKYCGDDAVYYRIRRQVRPEGKQGAYRSDSETIAQTARETARTFGR